MKLPSGIQQIKLCHYKSEAIRPQPVHTLIDTTREESVQKQFFLRTLPAPIELDCTKVVMTDGQRLSPLSKEPADLARLTGLQLIELPSQNTNDKKQKTSLLPTSAQDAGLSRTGFSLPSGPGPDDNWFPPPSPGSNLWGIMWPSFRGRMVENHSETIYRQDGPVLRLILQQGLLLEGITPSGQVILRHFIPVAQMESFLQWFMDLKPETTRRWLGVDWQDEYLITSDQAAAAIINFYSQSMARRLQNPELYDNKWYDNKQSGLNVPGILGAPLHQQGQTVPAPQTDEAASSLTNTGAASTAAVSAPASANQDGDGSEIPEEVFVHCHIGESGFCPMPGCDYAPCRCPQCISGQTSMETESTTGNNLIPDELFPALCKKSIRPLELGILLDLPVELLLSLSETEAQRHCEGLKKTLMTAGDNLTVKNLQTAINNLSGSASSLSHTLDIWMQHQGIDASQVITDAAKIDELYNIMLSFADQWASLYTELNGECCDNIEEEIHTGVSQEACLLEVLKRVPDLTVKKLIEAFEEVEENFFAQELKKRYTNKLDDSITAIEATAIIRSKAYTWYSLGIALDVSDDELQPIENYRLKNFKDTAKYKIILQQAYKQGSLTKENIIQVLKVLEWNNHADQLEKIWKEKITVKLPTKKELWDAILVALEQKQKPSIAKVLALMKMGRCHGETVMLALNQPPSSSNPKPSDFNHQLIVAAAQGELVPEAFLTMLKGFPRKLKGFPSMCDHQDYSNIEQKLNRLITPDSQGVPFGSPTQPEHSVHRESRVLKWRDLYELTRKGEDSLRIAVYTSLLLGVSVSHIIFYDYRSCTSAAIHVWENILRAFPYLQTGHLKELFNTFPNMQDYTSLLPAGIETQQPTVMLRGLSPLAAEIVQIAENLYHTSTFIKLAVIEEWTDIERKNHLSNYMHLPFYLKPIADALVSRHGMKELFAEASVIPSAIPGFLGASKQTTKTLLISDIPPDDHVCPITLELIDDPVAILTGSIIRYFSKATLLKALTVDPRNPLSRNELRYETVQGMKIDHIQKSKIKRWREEHPDYQ